MTHDEWKAEAVRLFGPDARDWRFRCPRCGNEASCGDFERTLEGSGGRAPAECIGRLLGAGGEDKPCDWAAFGLLVLPGTLTVTVDGQGEVRAFPFAQSEDSLPLK